MEETTYILTCSNKECKNHCDGYYTTFGNCPDCGSELTEWLAEWPDKKSAIRYNSGKLRWSLVDFDALEDMVKVLEFGTEKYTADNWKKGLKTNEIAESMMRHLFAYLRGEDIDPESGLPHTGHIMCNAMFLSYMQKFNPNYDVRRIDKNKRCCGNWDADGICKCKEYKPLDS
jgi:hypothetical protein